MYHLDSRALYTVYHQRPDTVRTYARGPIQCYATYEVRNPICVVGLSYQAFKGPVPLAKAWGKEKAGLSQGQQRNN